jgi:hypothetical protein
MPPTLLPTPSVPHTATAEPPPRASPATSLRQEGQFGFWLSHVARHSPQNMCPHDSVWHASSSSWQIGHARWLEMMSETFPRTPGLAVVEGRFSLLDVDVGSAWRFIGESSSPAHCCCCPCARARNGRGPAASAAAAPGRGPGPQSCRSPAAAMSCRAARRAVGRGEWVGWGVGALVAAWRNGKGPRAQRLRPVNSRKHNSRCGTDPQPALAKLGRQPRLAVPNPQPKL